ncbi:MAG: hypothetical protein M1820_008372 [Bogoriella megaspora]|nr:MAG: hypothetical protein M1820_008372 [Bogoriella megaspora]
MNDIYALNEVDRASGLVYRCWQTFREHCFERAIDKIENSRFEFAHNSRIVSCLDDGSLPRVLLHPGFSSELIHTEDRSAILGLHSNGQTALLQRIIDAAFAGSSWHPTLIKCLRTDCSRKFDYASPGSIAQNLEWQVFVHLQGPSTVWWMNLEGKQYTAHQPLILSDRDFWRQPLTAHQECGSLRHDIARDAITRPSRDRASLQMMLKCFYAEGMNQSLKEWEQEGNPKLSDIVHEWKPEIFVIRREAFVARVKKGLEEKREWLTQIGFLELRGSCFYGTRKTHFVQNFLDTGDDSDG